MRAEINTRTSTRVPSCPTELMTLGRTLKRRAGDFLAYFDHPHNHGWPYRSHLRPPRTPTRLRPRIPKPHQLHHPLPPRNRRIQTPTTPPIMKSLQTDEQITPITTIKRHTAAAGRVRHRPRSLTTAGVEVRSSSRTSTSTRNPQPTPTHPHSTRKSRETSPTTSPEHSSKQEDSDPNYTLNYEEPV